MEHPAKPTRACEMAGLIGGRGCPGKRRIRLFRSWKAREKPEISGLRLDQTVKAPGHGTGQQDHQPCPEEDRAWWYSPKNGVSRAKGQHNARCEA